MGCTPTLPVSKFVVHVPNTLYAGRPAPAPVVLIPNDHTCAICGLRFITPQGLSALEAAHIVPFSICHNDDPRNGLWLCKLHHWCYDQGLVSVADDLTMVTSATLDPHRPTEDRLTAFAGRPILAPHDPMYLPSSEALEWHRSNVLLQV